MKESSKFFNFPIQLLHGFMNNSKECFANIFDYSVFQMVYSEDAIYDDLDEFMEEWNISIPKSRANRIYSNGKLLYDSFNSFNLPWTGIHKKTYFKIRDETDEFKLICFLAYSAFKSIIQKKQWCKVPNDLILARMAGLSGYKNKGRAAIIPSKIAYWMKSKSQRRKRVFQYLETYNGLVYLPKSRGIIFSLTCSFKELVYYVEEKKVVKEISEKDRMAKKNQTLNEVKAEMRELIRNRNRN
ncbi:MAG TPA: hypothetical protein DCY95_10445 [Algoriphagus sp.]|uniref:hypothetical protein n=4 Tax=Algoriphagus TaxID=246875 RepID=UPI000C5D8FD0|nr:MULTISPECIES: hypothetical protein [unclassified Algoriphagus]MAL15101.1 hypothetical protein [Algoriphagus sp.]MAN87865.1 hypothetical protein [Algoriphagus sp.]HAD49924.1 hypothetical protein [Algoriphagus sp.]HAH36812.1 hypothetical protein [Algoriphagus sp.]HAS57302.1 hypothetical protein [Algoriphagus sp.]|tara:strand:+ start:18027 stop:18752 length:726 start_codon:yes stop_codon:yes gene_type:complete